MLQRKMCNCDIFINVIFCPRLSIKQPPSKTFISGEDNEIEWAEFKLDETNYLTIDKQQVMFQKYFGVLYVTFGY